MPDNDSLPRAAEAAEPAAHRNPRRLAVSALVFALFLSGAGCLAAALLTRPGSLLSRAFPAIGQNMLPAYLAISAAAAAAALIGYRRAAGGCPVVTLEEAGLRIRDGDGVYLLEWTNLEAVSVTRGGSLGIRVRDPARAAETHTGSQKRREALRSLPRTGDWNLLFLPSDLDLPVDEVARLAGERAARKSTNF